MYTVYMEDSIFTKIIKGEIPSHKIYEDDKTYAFLDIHPVLPGHVLVIPKKQVEFIWDLDEETYIALMKSVKKIGKHLRDVWDEPHVTMRVVGVDVPHAHVHLIPFSTTKQLHKGKMNISKTVNDDELALIAKKLAF
jgi:histidine triad (HIT) family protein